MNREASCACKGERLALARVALQMPAPNPLAIESATKFLKRVARVDAQQCPCCTTGRLAVVQTLAGQKQLPAPGRTVLPQGRGPA